jgi:bifunctional DNA-binding transcriptional regulator/antitoxin component of YhaV-PrlF toxin-antitoxin module
VTIPAEVRKALGLGKRDKVIFSMEDGVVKVKKPAFTLETAYASIEPLRQPEDWEARIREAKDEKANAEEPPRRRARR